MPSEHEIDEAFERFMVRTNEALASATMLSTPTIAIMALLLVIGGFLRERAAALQDAHSADREEVATHASQRNHATCGSRSQGARGLPVDAVLPR